MGSDSLQTPSTPKGEGKSVSEEHSDALVGMDVFPHEILDAFFLQLDGFSLLRAAQVNRKWYLIISGDFPRYLKNIVGKLHKKHSEDGILKKFVELIKLKESNRIFQSLSSIAFSKVKVDGDKCKSAVNPGQNTDNSLKPQEKTRECLRKTALQPSDSQEDPRTEADKKFLEELKKRQDKQLVPAKGKTLDPELLAFYVILWRWLGKNPLRMAMRHSPQAVELLLQQSGAVQTAMWTQTRRLGSNFLMHEASILYPKALPHLLAGLAQQKQSVQEKVWLQIGSADWYRLMRAAPKYPEAVPHLLARLARQKESVQEKVWTQTNEQGRNALMFAIKERPASLPHLLEGLAKQDKSVQETVWETISPQDWHILIFNASRHSCKALASVLKALAQQKESVQEKVWGYRDNNHRSIFELLHDGFFSEEYLELLMPVLLAGLAEQKESAQATMLSNLDAQSLKGYFSKSVESYCGAGIDNPQEIQQAVQFMVFKALMKCDMEQGPFACFKRSHLYKRLGQEGEGGVTTMEQVRAYAQQSSGSFFLGKSRTSRLLDKLDSRGMQEKTPGCFSGLFCR